MYGTLPSMRVFFAIVLPQEIQIEIGAIIADLKDIYKQPNIRWTTPKNLHVTLKFLPELKPEDVEKLIKHVQTEIKFLNAFNLEIGKLEVFPFTRMPNIISLQVEAQSLYELATFINRAAINTGYSYQDSLPFRPHLTLARLPKDKKEFILPALPFSLTKNILIREFALYESKKELNDSCYILLNQFQLNLR